MWRLCRVGETNQLKWDEDEQAERAETGLIPKGQI
jgi:hypothetical protein